MKKILFCLMFLLACFHSNNSHATDTKQSHKFEFNQKDISVYPQVFFQQVTNDHLTDQLIELAEDDNTDPEDENCIPASTGSTIAYINLHDFLSVCFKTLHPGRERLARQASLFILFGVFRL